MIKRKLNLKWVAWLNEKTLTKEFLELAVEAGCVEISFSSDAFSEKTLKALRKNLTVSDIKRGSKYIKEVPNLKVTYNFFVNPPEQTIVAFCLLVLFILKIKIYLGKQSAGFLIGNIRIEPHTRIHEIAIKRGILDKSTSLFPKNEKELKKLFFINPETKYLEIFLSSYNSIRKTKHLLVNLLIGKSKS